MCSPGNDVRTFLERSSCVCLHNQCWCCCCCCLRDGEEGRRRSLCCRTPMSETTSTTMMKRGVARMIRYRRQTINDFNHGKKQSKGLKTIVFSHCNMSDCVASHCLVQKRLCLLCNLVTCDPPGLWSECSPPWFGQPAWGVQEWRGAQLHACSSVPSSPC